MKRSNLIFTVILLPLDFSMFILAGILPYFLRGSKLFRGSTLFSPIFHALPLPKYLVITFIVAFIWLIFFALAGLYNLQGKRRFLDQIIKIILACSAGMTTLIIFLFFKREFLFSSRFIILSSWLIAIFLVIFERLVVRVIRHVLLKKKIGMQKLIVVGDDENTENLIYVLKSNSSWGYQIVGDLKNFLEDNFFPALKKIKNETGAEEVVLAHLDVPKNFIRELLDFCHYNHLNFRYAADIFSARLRNIDIDTVAGIPLIEIKRTPLEGWGRVTKRIFDFVGALVGFILLFPFFLILGIIIRFDSEGSILVKLKRIGSNGKPFYLYKFRSMVKDAEMLKKDLLRLNEREGPLFKIKNDPRVTRVGKFIRRWSIDELPQLINVLKGEMSLIGPRPHEPEEVSQYQRHHRKLLAIKPGITGMAQISGRSELSFEEEARLDTYYVENWSLLLDINILFKTPVVVLVRKAAY